MKIGLVYTGTTPELVERVEREVRQQLGEDVELLTYQNADILALAREAGQVTPRSAALLMELVAQALKDGANAILNNCSSVGEVADSLQNFARHIGVPLVRIDEEMCYEAVRRGGTIAVMATLPTTLEPTRNTLLRAARELGRQIKLVDVYVENAFGLSPALFKQRMVESALAGAKSVDVILFAQGSMAYCEDEVAQATGIPVLSSPAWGAKALREALIKRGELKL
ncbi:MAG: aspartate/glutamate racemase family protein [Christensenellales bacterium]|jgi:aspartate/glutamate racemase